MTSPAAHPDGEPGSFHHRPLHDEEMVDGQLKWCRWLCEESLSGGTHRRCTRAATTPCGVWRPSEHSMMRWLGNYFDQVGREHMT